MSIAVTKELSNRGCNCLMNLFIVHAKILKGFEVLLRVACYQTHCLLNITVRHVSRHVSLCKTVSNVTERSCSARDRNHRFMSMRC
jgi:hypothetical protein